MDSGLGNALGAGWSVKTQDDRGKYYEKHDDILRRMMEINKRAYYLIDFFDTKTIN